MIISCKCTTKQQSKQAQTAQIEIDLSKFSPTQRQLLASGEFEWISVNEFELMLGMRRQAVKDLIGSGELVTFEIPQNPRTKLGYGRRAYVAVQTYPCNTCCPDHYSIDWALDERFANNEQ